MQTAERISVIATPLDLPSDPTVLLQRLPDERGRFLLESGGGPPEIARYSFLGFRPFLEFSSRGQRYTLRRGEELSCHTGDPLTVLDGLLAQVQIPLTPEMPPFVGGAVGYFGYDLGRNLETLPNTAVDDLQLPDLSLGFYDNVVVIDHQTDRVSLYTIVLPESPEASLQRAQEIAQYLARLPESAERRSKTPPQQGASRVTSNFDRSDYLATIQKAIDYIYAGDIFQVNIAQRFAAWLPFSSMELWSRLRQINPAPFAAFLDYGDFQVVSASPERFLSVTPSDDGLWKVETRPIKGTRRRGRSAEEDEALRADLAGSLKDHAELNMIVDLERNDLGRVSVFGTVKVPDARRIEAYPTVFHTVATVEGILRPGTRVSDLLRATFPGGSITGAPKVRALEIIEELEQLRRSIYTGSIGYIGFQGMIDLNIVIRTFVVKNGRAYFHAGGGIVADSRPADEYDETIAKATALIRALGVGDVTVVAKDA
jgi:para-aminobenzoate synthetase component 1